MTNTKEEDRKLWKWVFIDSWTGDEVLIHAYTEEEAEREFLRLYPIGNYLDLLTRG